jgi:A/G-specific adenine glycosylase
MDLGQLVCRPRKPDCPACPIAAHCLARRRGAPERYPRRRRKPPARRVFLAAAVAVRSGRSLVVQKPGPLLAKLWQFPAAEGSSSRAALSGLRRELLALGLRRILSVPPRETRHTMVNRHLRIWVYTARPGPNPRSKISNPKSASRWFTASQLRAAAIPTLTRKIALASGFLSER